MKAKCIIILLLSLTLLLPPTFAKAAPFYTEKTMKIIVATKPGGNYDFYGRMAAKFMQKHLPGSVIIVKNVPGAGHIIGTNQIYTAKPNGMTIGTFNRGLTVAQIAGLKGIKFDLSKMSWLGSSASEVYSMVVVPKFKTLADIGKAPLVRMATSGLGAQAHVTTVLFKKMSGYKSIRIATGYMGQEAEMAMMRGEADGQFASWSSLMPFVRDGHGFPLLFIGKKQPAGYEHVPMLQDVITSKKYKSVVDLLTALNVLARPFAGPPGIPKDRMKILQNAYKKAFADPELLEIVKRSAVPIDYVDGIEALKLIKGMLQIDPESREIIRDAYGIK